MIADTAKKLLDNGIAIIPLLPNKKYNHDTDILTKDYKVSDLIPDGNVGINLKKSNLYCIDLDTDDAIYFGNKWLSQKTRIHGRINNGVKEQTHFYFKSDGSMHENIKDRGGVDFLVDHNVVVLGQTRNKHTKALMQRYIAKESHLCAFNESILAAYNKVCFAAAITPHLKSINSDHTALKLDACIMRYTTWSEEQREQFLLDIFERKMPDHKDVKLKDFQRKVRNNNKKVKNAGYTAFAQCIGVDAEEVKKWFGWIGEVPEDSKYQKVKSYVDFISTGLDMPKLMTEEIPPLKYAVHTILPEGLTCIAGRPKSMKSWTMLDILFCVQNGLPFWGYQTDQGDCLGIFYEDGKRRLKDRIIKLGHQKLIYPTIKIEAPYLGFGLEESLEAWIDSVERPRLIVIDTLARVKPRSSKKSGTAYDHDTELLRDIQKLAITKQVTIVFVSHLTKAPQEYTFDRITGSAGMQGIPDTLWMIDKGDNSNAASIIGIGRDIHDFEYALEWNEEKWRYDNKGNLSEIKKLGAKGEIIDAMKALEASATKDIRPRTVVKHLGYSPQSKDSRNIAKTMQRMLEERELGRGDKFGTYVLKISLNL